MSFEDLTLNAAYVIYVGSSLFRSARRIRLALIATSIAFIVYGLVADNTSIIFWNTLFGLSHIYAVAREIIAERRVSLTDEQSTVRQELFSDLSVVDFLYLWSLGRTIDAESGDLLIEAGEEHSLLLVVLDGDVEVERADRTRVRADRHTFLGEMRLLSGAVANANVTSVGSSRLHSWDHTELATLQVLRPPLYTSLLSVLGRDLTMKLNTANPSADDADDDS